MGRIYDFLRRLVIKMPRAGGSNAEELRIAFKARYHNFKLLLNSNNKALEIMADIEEALKGVRPFGMTFVMSSCTRISTNVWQIIRHLNELAPGKYEELAGRFKEIQEKVNSIVIRKDLPSIGPLVLSIESVDKNYVDEVGSKIANLGEIRNRVHLKVSNGFSITASGYQLFMKHNDLQPEIDRLIQSTDVNRLDRLYGLSADLQQLIIRSQLPDELEKAINEQYRLLEEKEGVEVRVAVRSSALGEDMAGTSFAGQYRSELNVSRENIFQAYREVIASKYSLSAMSYRLNRGIRDEDVAMCVGCMSMVEAVSGGVAYSRNPIGVREPAVVINSAWGLPKSVVDGSAASDLFIISREDPMNILKKEIPIKAQELICYPEEGVCRLEITGEKAASASLSDDQAFRLSQMALHLEEYYGVPQDIEWALNKDGSFVILQCRPLNQADWQVDSRAQSREGEDFESIVFKGGITASPGVGAGKAFIVKKDMDALGFPEGAVLVISQSLPRWAPLLNRASAVIAGQGSIAGHLANVAREFGVPALFGVGSDIELLKNGQTLTVDADDMKVYEGRIEDLLKREESQRNLMEGSPVFEALKEASQHIIPLKLLDPDSPNFKPRNCRTFHDITRFCHEKAVDEMFRFGKEHRFPERSSKQLFCDVPMKWWVLNLDDGFKEEVNEKVVHLENIISIPMRAIWDGITAVPWEGPPPVDGKGFMSVMFQATTNTALVPGVRSQYGDRNYFMISKNYCSLSSRLGFHFSIIEALVSERSSENYISFQFKGGAADFGRKQKRALFIGEILEEYGFKIGIREDNLIARLEDREMESMKKSLRVLGYLTIHTRQLDMIMANSTSVNHYKAKINRDIHELAPPEG